MTSPLPQRSSKTTSHHLEKNNPREIFGWKIYDWANSAFYDNDGRRALRSLPHGDDAASGWRERRRCLASVIGAIHCRIVFSHLRLARSFLANLFAADTGFDRRLFKPEEEADGDLLLQRRDCHCLHVLHRRQSVLDGWTSLHRR